MQKSERNIKMEDGESRSLPPWKLDDLKVMNQLHRSRRLHVNT